MHILNRACNMCFLRKLEKDKRGKAIPVERWTCPEISRSLRLPYFKAIGT